VLHPPFRLTDETKNISQWGLHKKIEYYFKDLENTGILIRS